MSRRISHFSCGAASAVATKMSRPDAIWYCDTGGEDVDNARFLRDCEAWFGQSVTILKSAKYKDVWDLWDKKSYLSGVAGAPCTGEMKVSLSRALELPDDVHIFGYTADSNDMRRADSLRANWPDLSVETPLIDRGITKAACLALLGKAGISPPRVYAMGFHNANCIPCVKATSPNYWALVRREFPEQFERMSKIEQRLNAKLTRIKGVRMQIKDIPEDQDTTEPIAPVCDFMCGLAEQDLEEEASIVNLLNSKKEI